MLKLETMQRTLLTVLGVLALMLSTAWSSEADLQKLEDQMAKANEYAKALAAAEEAKTDAPDFAEYVTADWAFFSGLAGSEDKINYGGKDTTVGDAAKAILDGSSEGANKAIYDNVWSASEEIKPWITSNLWILISAFLVFIMHLGFCTLESGLCQKKNTVNILFKNCWIIAIGVLTYFFWGFNAHYPGDFNGFFAMGKPADYGPNQLLTMSTDIYNAAYTWWTDFIFQAMFAATAATIVSGAVAERVKLSSFMVFSVILVMFAYPFVGSWHWGGGWLSDKGFYDFAGSTVVHAFGGFAALGCVLVLGPRRGRYTANGTKPILVIVCPSRQLESFSSSWDGSDSMVVPFFPPSHTSFLSSL